MGRGRFDGQGLGSATAPQPRHNSVTLTPLLKRLKATGYMARTLRQQAEGIPPAMLCATGETVAGLIAFTESIVQLRNRLDAAKNY